jgi:outer membrane cobalamin receptor
MKIHGATLSSVLSLAIAGIVLMLPAPACARDRSPAAGKRADSSPATREGFLDTLFWTPEILVEANRIGPEENIMSRSGFVAVVNLSSRRHRVEDAASILSRSVGVRVRRYGGLGSFATMSIRGSSSSQVQFYLDGVPLNDPYSGVTDLNDISTGDLDRIEIYRGTNRGMVRGARFDGLVRDAQTERRGKAVGRPGLSEARRRVPRVEGRFSLHRRQRDSDESGR